MLKGLVGEWFNIGDMICEIKYIVKFDERVFVDLINNDKYIIYFNIMRTMHMFMFGVSIFSLA